jgi:hypothetical protein
MLLDGDELFPLPHTDEIDYDHPEGQGEALEKEKENAEVEAVHGRGENKERRGKSDANVPLGARTLSLLAHSSVTVRYAAGTFHVFEVF